MEQLEQNDQPAEYQMKENTEIDFKTPRLFLESLLNQLESNLDVPVVLRIGEELPDWEKISASIQIGLDEMESYAVKDVIFFSSAVLGHGFMSNFFHFDFFSPRLKVAVSFPYGMVLANEISRQEYTQNARSIIAALFLLFRAFQNGNPPFLPENASLLVFCGNFRTSFRLRDEAGIIREEQSWQGLLDLLAQSDESQDSTLRIFV